jgi:serine/threonine protein kinase
MIPVLQGWRWTEAERLGGGGYAQAYRCRHPDFPEDEYAVKVFDNPDFVKTFAREVQVLQALTDCPGTPALVAHGRDEAGRLCIVTTFAPGIRLDRHLRRDGTLTPAQTLELLRQLLAALACAHGRGWLHKDVKASNILMDGERFTLLDWGVAAPRGDGRMETIRAKQDFVAPECYWGRHDFATDFYSLGWLAVQVLSGALPYHFAEVRDADYRVAAHCMERPVLPEGIPAPLRSLILNWLDKEPARRLVGYDLDALLEAAPGREPDDHAWLDFRQIRHECAFLHRAARHGVPYAQYHYALRLRREGRGKEALYWLEKARAAGYVEAGYRLARILMKKDDEAARRQAAELLRAAAQAGHDGAQRRLAEFNGQG